MTPSRPLETNKKHPTQVGSDLAQRRTMLGLTTALVDATKHKFSFPRIGGLVVEEGVPMYLLREPGVQIKIQTTNSGLPDTWNKAATDRPSTHIRRPLPQAYCKPGHKSSSASCHCPWTPGHADELSLEDKLTCVYIYIYLLPPNQNMNRTNKT